MNGKEMLRASPILSRLMGVPRDMIRAHIKYKVGDIGRYCFLVSKDKTGKQCNQYYVMKSDIPKILHRELTKEEEEMIGGKT